MKKKKIKMQKKCVKNKINPECNKPPENKEQ